jgi:prephenate dehydratase
VAFRVSAARSAKRPRSNCSATTSSSCREELSRSLRQSRQRRRRLPARAVENTIAGVVQPSVDLLNSSSFNVSTRFRSRSNNT